ncbi:MAG: BatD family protein [Prevotella sp.]|nr:BatD family protein [Prevotella sp.]MDD7708464.1 BatD family protein [Prevotella sp.]MDY4150131.1 BatD family protein [Prevotella sp.]
MSMKRSSILLICLFIACACFSQVIRVSTPSRVEAGENFRVSFKVTTQDVDDFRSGLHSTDVVEVIAGPYTSSESSFQMVNGHTSSSSSITYTYTLYAAKSGVYNIPAAHARVGGKQISSRPAKVTVVGSAQGRGNNSPKMHEDDNYPPHMKVAGSAISGRDLFIKVSANKRKVYEQEPILLTYKVYTLVDLTQLEGKMPELTGFHTQEIPLPQQKSFHIERVNGKPYRTVTWSQYVMYPQMTGKMEIPSITFKGIVVQQNRSVDPFEAFFNGGSGYVEVKRNIVAPSIKIDVLPLPHKPANFSGGVGKFNISAQLNKNELKAGDPLSLRIVVGGIGNLKLIKQPVVNFPKDWDKYDPKVTDKTKLTSNGLEGNMIYDILAVPRNQGHYTIPPVELTYYDTSLNQYKTIKTQSFEIEVAKGDGSRSSVVDYSKDQPKDIKDIKKGEAELHSVDNFFFGSVGYLMSLLIPFAAFVALLVIFRNRAIDNADLVKMKGKKANKIATKRLRQANKLMLAGKTNEFYDEVLRALWGYVGDKLNMPAEKLSRENISEKLQSHNVDDNTISKFLSAIDDCEMMRFAPGDPEGNMNKTFESAMTAIMEIENVMKKKSNKAKVSGFSFVLMILMLMPLSANAITKQNADDEYAKGNYQQAIKDYQEILKAGVSSEIYYNLGNAYYRTDNITQALLAYERALQLSPGDNDIRFNLQYARSKTIDKITPETEMFFVTWYHSLVNFTSVDRWANTAIVSIVMALLLILVFLFAPQMWARKSGFYGSAVFLLLFVFANLFAFQQKHELETKQGAIVIAPTVNVKKTPAASGTDVFVIHEGTRVDITDRGMNQWRGVKLADGREGWLKTSQIEEI